MGAGNSKEKRIVAAKEFIENELSKHKIVVFSKSHCPYCKMAKNALSEIGADYHVVEIGDRDDCAAIQDALHQTTGARTVPRVFVNKKCIGGGTETKNMAATGELKQLIDAV